MKHMQYNGLSQFNTILDRMDGGNSIIRGKLEAFSFKQEKGHKWTERVQNMPFNRNNRSRNFIPFPKPNNSFSSGRSPIMTPPSPFSTGLGQFGMNEQLRRDPECFQHLSTSLKSCFPFHSFRDVVPEDYVKERFPQQIVALINKSLNMSMNDRLAMWAIVEEVICIDKCEVFRYLSFGGDLDPLSSEGRLWNWNYFFYNRKLKRVLIFQCHGKNKTNMQMNEVDEVDEEIEDLEEQDLFSSEDDDEVSNLKNLDFYYDLKRIPSAESVDFNEVDDYDEDDDDEIDFDLDFL